MGATGVGGQGSKAIYVIQILPSLPPLPLPPSLQKGLAVMEKYSPFSCHVLSRESTDTKGIPQSRRAQKLEPWLNCKPKPTAANVLVWGVSLARLF
ncbi:MAG: hypothetical protein ACHBN1_09320 [Heteroscytonema crispum UTEX LB 1556]